MPADDASVVRWPVRSRSLACSVALEAPVVRDLRRDYAAISEKQFCRTSAVSLADTLGAVLCRAHASEGTGERTLAPGRRRTRGPGGSWTTAPVRPFHVSLVAPYRGIERLRGRPAAVTVPSAATNPAESP